MFGIHERSFSLFPKDCKGSEGVLIDEFYHKQESDSNVLQFCKILKSISQTRVLTFKKRESYV